MTLMKADSPTNDVDTDTVPPHNLSRVFVHDDKGKQCHPDELTVAENDGFFQEEGMHGLIILKDAILVTAKQEPTNSIVPSIRTT